MGLIRLPRNCNTRDLRHDRRPDHEVFRPRHIADQAHQFRLQSSRNGRPTKRSMAGRTRRGRMNFDIRHDARQTKNTKPNPEQGPIIWSCWCRLQACHYYISPVPSYCYVGCRVKCSTAVSALLRLKTFTRVQLKTSTSGLHPIQALQATGPTLKNSHLIGKKGDQGEQLGPFGI